ncbi:NAD(P)-dependent oxidoreductase [Streptomyces sp. NPDC101118]|uniref:NAD(P)-dependent oxidoreductase n=1 Tax=Streptomyces sp. NPDC101118 TaxID=3366109 RepID=UPI003826932E
MKLAVFGATGGVGQEIVRQALAAGHDVTAVVRDPSRLQVQGAGLAVHRSGLDDPAVLAGALAGHDAVLSGLGARSRADAAGGIAAALTRAVLAAMEPAGVRRLLVVSAAPLGTPPPGEPLVDRMVGMLVEKVFAPVYADLAVMESELARSGTDWTAVRPPMLKNRPATGRYRTALDGNPRSARTIGRADVAHAMLSLVDAPDTHRRAVGVAY